MIIIISHYCSHVHATFWLGIEQCSNRRQNLLPDKSGLTLMIRYKAGGHCVLPAPIALWCLPSGSLPSVAGLNSRLLLHASGTPCQRRRRQLSRWRHSVSISSHGSSANRIQISSSDLSSRMTNCMRYYWNSFNLEVAMLYDWLIDWLIDWYVYQKMESIYGAGFWSMCHGYNTGRELPLDLGVI